MPSCPYSFRFWQIFSFASFIYLFPAKVDCYRYLDLILGTTTLLPHQSTLRWPPGDDAVELMAHFLYSLAPELAISWSPVPTGPGYSLDPAVLHENLSLLGGQVFRGESFPNNLKCYSSSTLSDEKFTFQSGVFYLPTILVITMSSYDHNILLCNFCP